MTDISRKEFLAGGAAAFGALFGGHIFASPKGWKPRRKPNLVFGVLSDTHMRCHYDGQRFYDHNGWTYGDAAVVMALKYFKRHGVDAVLHCGDVTDCGMVREMEFYREAFDKVYGGGPRPVSMMALGNHDIYGGDEWAQGVAKSKDPDDYKKLRLGSHNLSEEMQRIWGEPYDNIWHREIKGYHFFGFGWPRFTGEDMNEATPYEGQLYHDTPFEGRNYVKYVHGGLRMAEFVRREREEGRLDPNKPFFTATHALWYPVSIINSAMRPALGLKDGELCNGLGLCGHGHGSNAHFGFNWWGDSLCYPYLMCSTLAYWKSHGGENDKPRFAKGFGSGCIDVKSPDTWKGDHALIIRVYDDMMTIHRFWVNVLPKPAIGSLGPDWVMPLKGFTPGDHPLKPENYAKVIGKPEFPRRAKLVVSTGLTRFRPHQNPDNPVNPVKKDSAQPCPCVKIKIPKADGNPDTRVYGYQIEITGSDRNASLKKNCYARGYNMGMGHEPEGGVTTLEIPKSELPKGRRLTISVTPCSSLGTKGKPISARFNA